MDDALPKTSPSTSISGNVSPRLAALKIGGDVEKGNSKLVAWDDAQDPANPMNWSSRKKWVNLAIISTMTFIVPISSSMFAPAVPLMMKNLHSTSTNLETWVVSIFVLGFAVGPLLVAPLSELYGRRPLYVYCNALFLVFTIACAVSSSIAMLVAFRFLAGCAGSGPLTLGAATIADMFAKENRGAAMAIFGIGALLGPSIGPIIGGYASVAMGWRWIFWLQTIIAGVTLLVGVVLLNETYEVYLLEAKTRRIIRETGDEGYISALHDGVTATERSRRAIVRPMKMLVMSPIILLLSIYSALLYGYLYLFVTTFPTVFMKQYGFTTGQTGLTYLGIGLGCLMGLAMMGKLSDPIYARLTARNRGVSKPEFRLPLLLIGCPLLIIAFFAYGWSSETKTHWIVPIIFTSVFAIGMIPGFISINMYLVEAYTRYGASAVAATKVLQSIGGALFPLAGQPLYDTLGLGWGNSVLAFIAMIFIPVPWFFMKYGEQIRMRFIIEL